MKKALFLSIIAAAFLAACGSSGGGGSVTPPGGNPGGGNPSPSPSPTATPTNPPGAVTLTDQALEPIITSQLTTQFFLASLSNGLPPTATYVCNSQGVTRTYTQVTGTQQSGTATVDTKHYSDATCATLVSETTDSDTMSNSGTTETVLDSRSTTTNGNTRTSTLQWMVASGGSGSFSALLGAGTTDTNGHSIQVTPGSSAGTWKLNISNATLLLGFNNGSGSADCPPGGSNPPCFQYGNTGATVPGSASVTQTGSTYTYTGTHQETLYHGNSAGSGLTLSPDPTLPACTTTCFQPFSITPLTPNLQYGSNNVTATITFDTAGNVQSATVSAVNNLSNPPLAVNATLNASAGTITGTITTAQGNQPVGTFQTGLDGNGTLSANGKTYTITNFIVQAS